MKWLIAPKQISKPRPPICTELNTHKWATKMELQRIIGGRPDLELKTPSKNTG